MKRILTNSLAALALVAGLAIGAVCHGFAAFLGAIALAWAGAVTLINGNTDWIWRA